MTHVQSRSSPIHAQDGELVLAAGGIKGYGHIGALMTLRDFEMTFRKVTGVSVGSIIAAFLTNGYTPEQILEIFEDSVKSRNSFKKLFLLFDSVPDPMSVAIGGFMDLYPAVRQMVEHYKLRPNEQLRIVACNLFKHQPVVFEFTDGQFATEAAGYDAVAHAITSSCSLPSVFRPQWHRGAEGLMLLGDGAVYHYNPTEFCSGPAVVIRFNQATELPRELCAPWDVFTGMFAQKSNEPAGAVSPWEYFAKFTDKMLGDDAASGKSSWPLSLFSDPLKLWQAPLREFQRLFTQPMGAGYWSMPMDYYFSAREIFFPLAGNQRYVDETKHLVVDIGLPDVAGLYMGAPEAKRRALVENGKAVTADVLEKAAQEGRLLGAKIPQ